MLNVASNAEVQLVRIGETLYKSLGSLLAISHDPFLCHSSHNDYYKHLVTLHDLNLNFVLSMEFIFLGFRLIFVK